tara:strand:+ start:9080 stop:9769 length:690 start_codon:yes stop_codon:yes gene_type:complete
MNALLQILPTFTVWAIAGLGIAAVVIVIERVQALYFKYSLDSESFLEKIKGLILSDKIGEAVNLAAAHEHVPVGKVTKSLLERANRDDEAIQQALDISLSEAVPLLTRRLGFLNMIANVATLFGLLGTITGLIIAFQAVSTVDASQKQTILTQGISLSMNTTAFGLSVAIPVMIIYSVLQAKQADMIEKLSGGAAKVLDYLLARNYRGFDRNDVFSAPKVEPPSADKVS